MDKTMKANVFNIQRNSILTDRVSEQTYFLKGVLCVADGAAILNRGEQNLLYIAKT